MAKEKKHGHKYDFASTDLLVFMWDKRIPLLLITGVAAVLSIIVSFTITPLFKSTVTMFPTTNTPVSKNLISENYFGRGESIYEIGAEEQAEQMLQVLNSDEIRNRITKKYDLMKHYKIKPDSDYPMTKLMAKYNKYISFKRTQFNSVEIKVLDKDPQIAANIANDIAALTDTVFNNMIKQRSYSAISLVQNEYDLTSKNLQELRDSLNYIRRMGVNNYETQAERYHEAYGKALIEGNSNAIEVLEKKLNTLSKYGGAYVSLSILEDIEAIKLGKLKQKLAEAMLENTQTLPHKFIVDSAFKAEKKISPKKSIIVLVAAFSSFLIALIMLVIVDNLKIKE